MPRTSGILQNLRSSGYGKTQAVSDPTEDRVLNLSDEEMQVIPPSNGQEICLSVYGTVDENGFHVSRVEPEKKADITPQDVMGPPSRAMPSPS